MKARRRQAQPGTGGHRHIPVSPEEIHYRVPSRMNRSAAMLTSGISKCRILERARASTCRTLSRLRCNCSLTWARSEVPRLDPFQIANEEVRALVRQGVPADDRTPRETPGWKRLPDACLRSRCRHVVAEGVLQYGPEHGQADPPSSVGRKRTASLGLESLDS